MASKKVNSSPKQTVAELIGKNFSDIDVSLDNNINIKTSSEFQLPLPSSLTGPVRLSAKYEEALDQLHYLLRAKLIKPDEIYFEYTDRDPEDEWIYDMVKERPYRSYFLDWVWAEGDSREARKNDIFRLRQLFEEDESEDEIDETDHRNQREGDTTVYWLLDYCRYIFDIRPFLPLHDVIDYKMNKQHKNYIILPRRIPTIRNYRNRRYA